MVVALDKYHILGGFTQKTTWLETTQVLQAIYLYLHQKLMAETPADMQEAAPRALKTRAAVIVLEPCRAAVHWGQMQTVLHKHWRNTRLRMEE